MPSNVVLWWRGLKLNHTRREGKYSYISQHVFHRNLVYILDGSILETQTTQIYSSDMTLTVGRGPGSVAAGPGWRASASCTSDTRATTTWSSRSSSVSESVIEIPMSTRRSTCVSRTRTPHQSSLCCGHHSSLFPRHVQIWCQIRHDEVCQHFVHIFILILHKWARISVRFG